VANLDEALRMAMTWPGRGTVEIRPVCGAGDTPQWRDLTDDAEWLAALLATARPTEPEVLGLLALIRLHRARALARFDDQGRLVTRQPGQPALILRRRVTTSVRSLGAA
jgi:predicted RNA polymerase sigma factor